MPNKPLVFVLFLALFLTTFLSACGSKGDLYQTPEPEADKNEQVTVSKNNEQAVQTPQKK
jgi:predicted small lipoprotein YifL